MNQTCNIYIITNDINEKVYIGQTWNSLSSRLSSHKKQKAKTHLTSAIKKYGEDHFQISIVVTCSDQMTADYLEKFWIIAYNSIEEGYNLREGGSRGRHSEKTKEKMSKSRLGWILSEDTKKKISEANKGKKLSDETKKKMSLLQMNNKHALGCKRSEEFKKKVGARSKDRRHSEETKQKMSASKLGRKVTDEQKIAQSIKMTGRKLSSEHRKAISQSIKGQNTWMKGKKWKIINGKREYIIGFNQTPESTPKEELNK